jgi:hypothetical protein
VERLQGQGENFDRNDKDGQSGNCEGVLEAADPPTTLSAELAEVSKGRMIAATALVEGLTLITVNGEDFRDVPGLEFLVWEAGG